MIRDYLARRHRRRLAFQALRETSMAFRTPINTALVALSMERINWRRFAR